MGENREEQLSSEVEKENENLLSSIKTNKYLKNQLLYFAMNHEKYTFMEDNDLQLFKSSLFSMIKNELSLFTILASSTALIYKICGGFTPSLTHPWKRKLRHISVILLPSQLASQVLNEMIFQNPHKNLEELSQKYREKLLEPEFNEKFINQQQQRNNEK